MNLHFIHETKFFHYFIKYASQFKDIENKYIIYRVRDTDIPLFQDKNIIFAPLFSKEFWDAVGDLSKYRAVYIHFLSDILLDVIEKIPSNTKLIWVFWGSDAFSLPKFQRWQIDDDTFKFVTKEGLWEQPDVKWSINLIKTYYSFKQQKKYFQCNERIKKVMKRFDFFAHYIPYDYNLIKKFYGLKAEYIDFQYCSGLEEIKEIIYQEAIDKQHILLGNSAATTNNHISMMNKLVKMDLGDRKIYCPLSYSGYPQYIEYIAGLGQKYFGQKFVPLLKEINVLDYNRLINSCALLLMNHKRSQAGSNIYAALYAGAKVYMNKESTLFKLLKQRGFHLYTNEYFFKNKKQDFLPLTNEQAEENRRLFTQFESDEVLLGKFYALLTI